jgi:hypothetical protein
VASEKSWRLKLDRAEEHLLDLHDGIARYADKHAYEVVRQVRGAKCHQHADCWRYRLRITEQPDPWLAILAGDVIHNLRSSLDHLAVAIAPRSRKYNASFPICKVDPWERQGRRYLHHIETRRSFNTAVKGMADEAVAAIKELQPYRQGAEASIHIFAQLSRLENADKHRELIPYAAGLNEVTTTAKARGHTLDQAFKTPRHFIPDDAQIAHFGWNDPTGPPLQPSEVKVQVRGTPLVAVKVIERDMAKGQLPAYAPLDGLLRHVLDGIRDKALPALEPFVR